MPPPVETSCGATPHSCRHWQILGLIGAAMREQCPHDARVLVRQGHRCHVLVAPTNQLCEPSWRIPRLALCHTHNGAGTMNQQRSQVRIAPLADASSSVLPPLECCRGTNPSQAASWRAFLKLFASPIVATKALAVSGPMPGICASFLLAAFSRCQSWICASNSPTWRSSSFRCSPSRTSNRRKRRAARSLRLEDRRQALG